MTTSAIVVAGSFAAFFVWFSIMAERAPVLDDMALDR